MATSKRYEQAISRVLAAGWTIAEAARVYEVSRQHLSKRVNEERARLAQAGETVETRVPPPTDKGGRYTPYVVQTRLIPPYHEWDFKYFGHLPCPDCGPPHKMPGFHREVSDAIRNPDNKRVLVNLPPFHAKVLEDSTRVPTPDGWTTIGDLSVGDTVFDIDGRPTKVIAKSEPILCTKRVTLGDWSEFDTDEGHRWWVEPRRSKKSRFVTTGEMMRVPHLREYRIPLAAPLELPERDLPLDPYVLGAWLGDGASAGGRMYSHESDQPFMRSQFERAGFRTSGTSHPQCFSTRGLHTVLRLMGVLGKKHVPPVYLRASVGQRLALLRGLMDTDGTVHVKAGNASFTNKREHLADAVYELAASLGWKPRRSKSAAMLNGVNCGPAFRVSFCPTRSRSPFLMPRKTALLPTARTHTNSRPFRSIGDADPRWGHCIAVDSPTQTFLVGEAMVPTGNTTLVSVRDTIYDLCADPNSRTIIVSKSLPFARTIMHGIDGLLTNPELYEGGLGNLIEDYGPFKPQAEGVWSSEQIYVAGRMTSEKDPSVLVIGYGQQIYGRRANKIKFDDVATLENQKNPARVQETLTWTDQEALTRIGKNGIAIWAGTRVHPGDIYHYLGMRSGYVVIRRPVILDENEELTLWPEHFPFSQALQHKTEMRPTDFQLVYQQQDTLGVGASFTEEIVDSCKDTERVRGHRKSPWRVIGGLDLAGGTKGSGYTCFTALGLDLNTGRRYVVDQISIKSMRAPQIRDTMFEWTEEHGVSEWRVESNGLQSQVVQYNTEIIQELARRGVRVVPHVTKGQGGMLGHTVNKWDPQFGVESVAPLFSAGLYSIPWGNAPTRQAFLPLVEELLAFPMGVRSDRVMSLWFADLGARELLKRQHLPLFSNMKVPARIRRGRRVVDFANQEIRSVPPHLQRISGRAGVGMSNYRRTLLDHGELLNTEEKRPLNVQIGEADGSDVET